MAKQRSSSPLWHEALDRYRDELKSIEEYESIQDIQSLKDLVNSFENLQAAAPRHHPGLSSMHRLGPRLKFIDDFSAVLALCFGADTALTAAVWGSIRLILSHASSAAETFQDVLDMLEELSLTLPRFQMYESTLPLNRSMQSALVDVYSEVICFYARAIHFLRNNPHLILRKNEWTSFQRDFSRTLSRIKRISSIVETEADIARMRKDETKYREVLDVMNTLSMSKAEPDQPDSYKNIPFPRNAKFSGRDTILSSLQSTLDPASATSHLKSIALFGLGGVGKTQIAIQYAYQNLNDFDMVFWVAADNAIAIAQSFRTIADALKLWDKDEGEGNEDAKAAIWKVKNWLNSTKSTWLIVFDNADDPVALRTVWPGTVQGSVIVTTRDFSVATSLPLEHLQVDSFGEDDGRNLLLQVLGTNYSQASPSDQEAALSISRAFGGFPLALAQIGGFINQRRLRLGDFMKLYERNAGRIEARKSLEGDYEHTLSTVWDISFGKLMENSVSLLSVLSFLDPDCIPEEIILQGSADITGDFTFLSDELDLGDASEELLRGALINRNPDGGILSLHRLVQSAALRRISENERTTTLDIAVKVLSWGFPDTWSKDVGHQVAAWSKCEKCLPHVHHLSQQTARHKVRPGEPQAYAELLLRCSWYLYEREMYTIARDMVRQALESFVDKSTASFASAIDLDGLIDLDLAEPSRALEPFNQALEIRKALFGSEHPFIAFSLNNIALAYTEMGELEKAHSTHEEAIRLRLQANSDRIGNSYSNMSSLLLRMGKPDEAEEMLARCPSLKDFTDETFLSSGNPRFSGDMVLLSRIRLAQGKIEEALRLASKALVFRQEVLGGRLKTCDSQYDVASILLKMSHVSPAKQLFEELIAVTETFVEGKGQRARALCKLSGLYEDKGMQAESKAFKEQALELRTELKPELNDCPFVEEEFAKLCVWMLW